MTDKFAIEFMKEQVEEEGIRSQFVSLTLGDFEEGELADLTNWSVADYEKQWLFELNQTLGTLGKGALILSIHDSKQAHRIWTWTMWRKDEIIHFQNRLLFMLELEPNFDPVLVHEHIGEHRLVSEDGELISDWAVSVSAVQEFLSKKVFAQGDPCSTPS